jgi:hypothetical protein
MAPIAASHDHATPGVDTVETTLADVDLQDTAVRIPLGALTVDVLPTTVNSEAIVYLTRHVGEKPPRCVRVPVWFPLALATISTGAVRFVDAWQTPAWPLLER